MPEACQNYFRTSNPARRYETRKTNYFEIPFSRTEVRKKSINVYGPELWNALPTDLQNTTSIFVMKRGLVNHIVSEYT